MIAVVAVALAANTEAVVIQSAFARWKQLANDTKSLAVEFTLTRKDRVLDREEVFDCTLRLLRTDSDVLAKLVARNRATKETQECVLKNRGFHLPNPTAKSLLVYRPGTVLPTVAEAFSPLLAVLGTANPETMFSLKVSRREKWYTHLEYEPNGKDAKGGFERGRVVIVHRTNDTIPVGAPRQLCHDLSGGQTRVTLDLQKWEMNGNNTPKTQDFDLPGEKDGWKVTVTEGFWKELRKLRKDK